MAMTKPKSSQITHMSEEYGDMPLSQWVNDLPQLKDPTETKRGAPMEATAADVTAATSGVKMMSPRRVLAMIRGAVSEATETLRGTLRVGAQWEVIAGTSDNVAVTPKKLRAGFVFSTTGGSGFIVFPSWLGSFTLQWREVVFPANTVQEYGAYTSVASGQTWPVAWSAGMMNGFIVPKSLGTTGPWLPVSMFLTGATTANFSASLVSSFAITESSRGLVFAWGN